MITSETISKWMKGGFPHPLSNELFYKTQNLADHLSKKEVLIKEQAKTDLTNPIDGIAIMPEHEIAILGTHRESSCVRICGDFVELYITTSSYIAGKGATKGVDREKDEDKAKKTKKSSIARSAKRAEKTVRRLVNTNRLDTMWTLTFAPDSEKNREKYRTSTKEEQSDPSFVKTAWRHFYRKIKKDYPKMKWLVVFELHDSEKTSEVKRGTWHIHFATDTRLEWKEVFAVWEWGNVRFDDFSKPKKGSRRSAVRNPGAYMSKYIGKSFDESNFHVKRYSRSRNMQVPTKMGLAELLTLFPGLAELEETFHTERSYEHDGAKFYSQNITFRKTNKR